MQFNPFDKNNRLQKEFKDTEAKVKADLKELSIIANNLLIDQRYRRFTQLVEKAETNIMKMFFRFREVDPYKYKSKMDEFLIELQVYNKIIRTVTDLSQEKPPQKVNLVADFKSGMNKLLEGMK